MWIVFNSSMHQSELPLCLLSSPCYYFTHLLQTPGVLIVCVKSNTSKSEENMHTYEHMYAYFPYECLFWVFSAARYICGCWHQPLCPGVLQTEWKWQMLISPLISLLQPISPLIRPHTSLQVERKVWQFLWVNSSQWWRSSQIFYFK